MPRKASTTPPKPTRTSKRTLDRNLIASLSHGLSVLEAVAAQKDEISLAALAATVGMKKTSTWRLVHTLVQMGYVRQDPRTRNFRPAPRVLALGYGYFDGLDFKQLSEPFLHDLAKLFDETVNLAVRDNDELVYIERIRTSQILNINIHVGSRLPLYRTALGRALICEMPDTWLQEYMGRLTDDLQAKEYIQKDGAFLMKLLDETRKQKYALNDEELTQGLRGIASPVRNSTGEIVAAVGVSVPSSRITVSDLRRSFVADLISTAEKISVALGHR